MLFPTFGTALTDRFFLLTFSFRREDQKKAPAK